MRSRRRGGLGGHSPRFARDAAIGLGLRGLAVRAGTFYLAFNDITLFLSRATRPKGGHRLPLDGFGWRRLA